MVFYLGAEYFIQVLHWDIKVINTRPVQINSLTKILFIWQETMTVKSCDYYV